MRASPINGCSPCVHAGVQSAKKHGETEERLHSVAAWVNRTTREQAGRTW
jgi:AhpD family alkylhydroperoxidase